MVRDEGGGPSDSAGCRWEWCQTPAPRFWQAPLLKAVNTRPLTLFGEWIRIGQSASSHWSQIRVVRATHLRQKKKQTS